MGNKKYQLSIRVPSCSSDYSLHNVVALMLYNTPSINAFKALQNISAVFILGRLKCVNSASYTLFGVKLNIKTLWFI